MMPPTLLPAIALSAASLAAAFPQGILGAALFFVLWGALTVGVVVVFNRVLHARARASKNPWDDVLAEAMRWPLALAMLLGGLWLLATRFDAVPASWLPNVRVALGIGFALTAAHAAVALAHGAMVVFGKRRPSFRGLQGVLEFMARLAAYGVAFAILLDQLGIEVTPILGALGIAGLAVALALQDTLSNFFAGMYITLDRPLREGDFVEFDGGALGNVKGYVEDVGWRSVRVRELSNNIYVVPNAKLAQGIIKNYDQPVPELSVLVDVSVAYGSDLEQVEHVTVQVAREVQREVAGAVPQHEPFIRYHTFGADGLGFTVILRAMTFVDQYMLKHAFVKALHARFRKEGIEIPFPQRVLHLAAGNGGPAGASAFPLAPPGPSGPPRRTSP